MSTNISEIHQMLPSHAKVQVALQNTLGKMQIGQKLTSERELAEQFGVSRPTIRRAVKQLCDLGILQTQHGIGTFLLRAVQTENPTRKSTRMIGLLMPTVRYPMIAQMVEAIEQVTTSHDYRIVLTHDHGDPQRQRKQLQQLQDHELDGLIVYPDANNVCQPHFAKQLNRLIDSGTPIVLVDRSIPDVNAPAIVADSKSGMYELTRHMLMHGRSRIAIVSWGEEAGMAHTLRLEGFKQAMTQAGLEPEPILMAQVGQLRPNEVTTCEAVEKWIADSQGKLPCDCIICFHDNMALGAFQALNKVGLDVPNDIALTGFDNLTPNLFQAVKLSLTTVNQPVGLIGDTAARLLVDYLDNKQPLNPKRIDLRCELIIRESCGCQHTA